MPFELASVLQIFQKTDHLIVASLHFKRKHIHPYFDGSLIRSSRTGTQGHWGHHPVTLQSHFPIQPPEQPTNFCPSHHTYGVSDGFNPEKNISSTKQSREDFSNHEIGSICEIKGLDYLTTSIILHNYSYRESPLGPGTLLSISVDATAVSKAHSLPKVNQSQHQSASQEGPPWWTTKANPSKCPQTYRSQHADGLEAPSRTGPCAVDLVSSRSFPQHQSFRAVQFVWHFSTFKTICLNWTYVYREITPWPRYV